MEASFLQHESFLGDGLYKVRIILRSTWLIILPGYTNVTKSFDMTLNSKHRTEKLKTKSQRYWNTKNENTDRRKSSFTERIGRKYRLM